MEHDDETAMGRTEWDRIQLLYAAALQAAGEAPEALRQLRVHCLRERSAMLMAAPDKECIECVEELRTR